MRKLFISIAVHNNLELTKKCLQSIERHTHADGYVLAITDNASTDGTREYLASLAGRLDITVATNEANLGYSRPHVSNFQTFTARFSGQDDWFFAVLNNDLEVCADWSEKMLQAFDDPKVGVCGLSGTCCALTEDGLGVPVHKASMVAEYAEGSCMVLRPSAVAALEAGLFDPVYKFAYYEDSDLSLRLVEAGWKVAHVDLPIKHIGAATANIVRGVDLEGYKIRNRAVFLGRWGARLKSRTSYTAQKDRIVIVRTGARGDVIMAEPAVRAFRRKFPSSAIVFSTLCPDVFQGNPDVGEVALQGKPFRAADLVFNLDMAYEKRPNVHPVKAYADVLGVELGNDVGSWRPRLYPTDTARIVALQRMPGDGRYAVIHPGMIEGWVGRQWKPANFAGVIAGLKERGYKTVLVGTDTTTHLQTDLDFRNIPFAHLVGIMERAALFVGLDSMPIHVAQACSVPTVGIFGCVDPLLRLVPGSNSVGVVAKSVGCLGCHHWLPSPRTVTNSCVRGGERCLDELSPKDVLSGVDHLIESLPEVKCHP